MRVACVTVTVVLMAATAVGQKLAPTLKDVSYGPHERNVLNMWKAQSETPTPVMIYIHGGGWLNGRKHEFMKSNTYLKKGVSVVSISYRLCRTDLAPAPLLDAARALQFVRYKAAEWGLDKTRIAVSGSSAGGCTSLWLAFHDDLADPESKDPVLRESSKPICAAVKGAQTFIDAKLVNEFVGKAALGHPMIWKSVGAKSAADAIENYDTYADLYRECSPYTHLDADDPPVLLQYGPDKRAEDKIGEGIHSARFGFKLMEKAKTVGATVYFSGPTSSSSPFRDESDFVLKMLKVEQVSPE